MVVARFDDRLAAMPAPDFIDRVLVHGLRARYVLVGDDFSFGAKRAGNYALLDAAGARLGFDVARMMSYEVHGLRVSSSAVRSALAAGDLALVEALLGRPYSVSGHVLHGRKLGRELGFRTLNLRFAHARAATGGCNEQTGEERAYPPRWARRPATAAACAWTCCTSCTTRCATARCLRCRRPFRATPRRHAAGSPRMPELRRGRPAHRRRHPITARRAGRGG